MWIVDGLLNAARMAWEVWWALILGFALSGRTALLKRLKRIEGQVRGLQNMIEKVDELMSAVERMVRSR
jgi:hypothetical protein